MPRGGAGGCAAWSVHPVADPAHRGRTHGLDHWQWSSGRGPRGRPRTHRARWPDGGATVSTASLGKRARKTGPGRPGGAGDRARSPVGPGRPRSRPFSWVTGLLSPAVRSRHWSEVPRRTGQRSVRLIAPAEPRVVRAGPPLAGTDTGTNEARPAPVTRRTGESRSELRSAGPGTRSASDPAGPGPRSASDLGCGGPTGPGPGGQTRPRHSSRRVIARAVPGLPRASL